MVGGWLLEGAPGVLSESSKQSEDKRIRSLSASSLASVEGREWVIEPKEPYTPYTFAATYSEGASGLYLYATVLNGSTEESKDGALLVEFFISNDSASKFSWFSAEKWAKEFATIQTKQVTYLDADGLIAKSDSAISCPRWPGRREPIPDNSEVIEVKAGGYQCFRLVFPSAVPSNDKQFSLLVSGIRLGEREVPSVKLNYDRIPK